jgi:protein TonB
VISRDGAIENLQVLSGHPMLVQAAVQAVRQWRYRPYVLNGEPVEVETQVTVNFVLGGG